MGIGPAADAENFDGCNKQEAQTAALALRSAKALSVRAAAAVGDTPTFEQWFGPFSPAAAEKVRGTLKATVTAIRTGAVTMRCDTSGMDGCDDRSAYAWVYPNRHYVLHLCPGFFDLPTLAALRPGQRSSDFGTKEGTIVHELTHFRNVAGTEDHCYARSECAEMAERRPGKALENADSYQYFTEDVTYYGQADVADKPNAGALGK